MAFGAPSLKGRALRWLAQREHSRAELARKLTRHAGDDGSEPSAASQIEAVLDELAAHGLLSDERAAASVLASQAPRGGERRLKQLLQQRGLAPELVSRTLAQARPGELDRARALWQRRFGMPAGDAAERARQSRFLAGRGFSGDIIRRVVQGTDDEQDGPLDK
jgi:regulatory protein